MAGAGHVKTRSLKFDAGIARWHGECFAQEQGSSFKGSMVRFNYPGPLFDGEKGKSLWLGRMGALLVMVWFVISVTAVAYRVVEREAARPSPAAPAGGTTRPADEVKTVTGMLKAVDAGRAASSKSLGKRRSRTPSCSPEAPSVSVAREAPQPVSRKGTPFGSRTRSPRESSSPRR